jgi:hypothetical protein
LLLEAAYLKEPDQLSAIPQGEGDIYYPDEKVNFNALLSKKLQFGH